MYVLEKAAAYARERIVFGRPIGQNQAIQHPLAECWIEYEQARPACAVRHAARRLARQRRRRFGGTT